MDKHARWGGRGTPGAILVVDAMPGAHRLVISLREHGFVGHHADSVAEAMQSIHELRPALVITEWYLPDGLGLCLVDECRNEPNIADSMVLTAFGSIQSALLSIRHGAIDYLTKPATAEQILSSWAGDDELNLADLAWPSLDDARRSYICEIFEHAGSVAQAARELCLDRRSLRRMMRRFGLQNSRSTPPPSPPNSAVDEEDDDPNVVGQPSRVRRNQTGGACFPSIRRNERRSS